MGHWKEKERRENPMIPSASIAVVVSNCVLNLVDPRSKSELFREMHRVLKRGGRPFELEHEASGGIVDGASWGAAADRDVAGHGAR